MRRRLCISLGRYDTKWFLLEINLECLLDRERLSPVFRIPYPRTDKLCTVLIFSVLWIRFMNLGRWILFKYQYDQEGVGAELRAGSLT